MITPEEIRRKAERVYPRILEAWVENRVESLFPLPLRANLSPVAGDLSATISAVEQLRARSKEQCGVGYSIEWKEKRTRDFGTNRFPERITIDTLDDLLALADRQRHFATTCQVARRLREELPGLDQWIVANIRGAAELAESLEGLIGVTRYFIRTPWPDCYARQIPVAVDTKFVERHQSVLRSWLDELLPASAIQADETKFALRFGLRDGQPHTTLRVLDPQLQVELGWPFDELSAPLRELEKIPVRETRIFIVENRLNLLTLPAVKRGLAIRGEGTAVTRLFRLKWLADNEVHYWGDLDVEGFQILSKLRSHFPHVRSLLMDCAAFESHAQFIVDGTGAAGEDLRNLTAAELALYRRCQKRNQRLEQEHLRQDCVDKAISAIGG